MDLGRAPQRVLEAHASDQVANFFSNPRSSPAWAGLPSPVSGKAHSMPSHNGLGSDDGYGIKDARAATIEPDEQSTVDPPQMWSARRLPLQNIELMTQ